MGENLAVELDLRVGKIPAVELGSQLLLCGKNLISGVMISIRTKAGIQPIDRLDVFTLSGEIPAVE